MRDHPVQLDSYTQPPKWIEADWPAPPWIHACTTTRCGGVSAFPYVGLNLADHVGESPECVRSNRASLVKSLDLPSQPRWLQQQHDGSVVDLNDPGASLKADGACTSAAGIVCAVLTADCLPLLLCDRTGTRVGSLHCGWRGLARGIIQSGLVQMQRPPEELMAWLGPAIGPQVYEVGTEVCNAFFTPDKILLAAFKRARPGHWLLDLYTLARIILNDHGIRAIYGGEHCTYSEPPLFYSRRRDGTTGRMASLIWIVTPGR